MRKFLIPAVAALAIGAATPALAYDSASQLSMQAALDVATSIGIVTVSNRIPRRRMGDRRPGLSRPLDAGRCRRAHR
jgi:hypothetical protein